MFVSLFLTLLIAHSTLAAVISELVLESSGILYLPANPGPNPTSVSSGTSSGIGTTKLSGLNITSARSAASVSGPSASTLSTWIHSGPSVSSTSSAASVLGPAVNSSASNQLGLSVSSTTYNVAGLPASNLSSSIRSGPSVSSTPSAASVLGLAVKSSASNQLGIVSSTTYNVAGLPASNLSSSIRSGPSVSSTPSAASVLGLAVGSSASNQLGLNVGSTTYNVAGRPASTLSSSIPSGLSLTSALSTPPITENPATTSGYWPASITFVAQSSSSDVVGVAFLTTVNGTAKITTTQPPQSLISPSASGATYSLIAITVGGSTTTLTLTDLPTATIPSEPTGVQVVTESGIPVIYSPITLSGYNNTEPVEISTIFTEIVDGQTTTQGGWYVMFPAVCSLDSTLRHHCRCSDCLPNIYQVSILFL